jgi:hypothetical protein
VLEVAGGGEGRHARHIERCGVPDLFGSAAAVDRDVGRDEVGEPAVIRVSVREQNGAQRAVPRGPESGHVWKQLAVQARAGQGQSDIEDESCPVVFDFDAASSDL